MTHAVENGGEAEATESLPAEPPAGPSPLRRRTSISFTVEILAAIILSVATVSSAWSAYQATRWSGVQATNTAQASALRAESTKLLNVATSQVLLDAQTFIAWVTAVSEDDTRRANFLQDRFRPEFKPAFQAWAASAPKGTIPAGSPFTMPEYQLSVHEESNRLVEEAEERSAVARDANQTGDNFILTTVLFATVLFFAGVSSKFPTRLVRRALLAIGAVVWTAAFVIMVSLPQNVGF